MSGGGLAPDGFGQNASHAVQQGPKQAVRLPVGGHRESRQQAARGRQLAARHQQRLPGRRIQTLHPPNSAFTPSLQTDLQRKKFLSKFENDGRWFSKAHIAYVSESAGV